MINFEEKINMYQIQFRKKNNRAICILGCKLEMQTVKCPFQDG